MERFETRYDRLCRKLAEVNGHKYEPNGPAKTCNRLQKPKSHRQLIRRVALAAGHLYGLPRSTVAQVMNAFISGMRDDLAVGDCYILRGIGVIRSDVRESKPRGKWRHRAAKMLRAEVHVRSSRSLRDRMKKNYGFKVEMETKDSEARARHRLRQMGLAKFGTTASIYRNAPSTGPKQQQPERP